MLCPSIVLAQALEFEPPLTDFRDVRRPNDITIEPDLGGTGHQALNFTGNVGAAGDTWITVYDPAPNPPPVTFGSVSLSADVLIHAYNNKKGAGLLALYNEAPGRKGLALTFYDAGNTDTFVLATVDQAGKLVTLKTVRLGAGIAENVWYRVNMDVTVDAGLVTVVGTVAAHAVPTDPNSDLAVQVGPTLTFSASLGVAALVGVDATGEVGILAAAVNAANSSSVTNVLIDPQDGGTSCLSSTPSGCSSSRSRANSCRSARPGRSSRISRSDSEGIFRRRPSCSRLIPRFCATAASRLERARRCARSRSGSSMDA
jgi:hypothetical protein